MNPNIDNTKARPDDTALNIRRGRLSSRASTESSPSSSPSLMDDSPPLECDYAECVAAQNMEVEVSHTSPLPSNISLYDFSLPPPRVSNEEALDPASNGDTNTSTEPSPPTVTPYSANVPADPSLWDGNFTATSLFGTNEFLHSDVRNMACSLQRMACFLKQRSLNGCNGNNIAQLELFGESAWDFISAIFESGWDQLYSSGVTSIRDNVKTHFGNIKNYGNNTLDNSTPKEAINQKILPPIPPYPTKKQMEKSKIHGKMAPTPSYAQAANSSVNILKIKEAFPALPNKKIIEIYNAAFSKPGHKDKKIQLTTKGPSQKQVIVPASTNLTNTIMEKANNHVFQINNLLKNIKLTLRAEFICPCSSSISIITNNIPNLSNLTIMECYLKSIEGANNNEILVPCLS